MNISAEALIGYCRERLAKCKVPRHLKFSETDLPKNGAGKVLKRLLRERFWAGAKHGVPTVQLADRTGPPGCAGHGP
jgi:long-chain acyl-CoA synthetase